MPTGRTSLPESKPSNRQGHVIINDNHILNRGLKTLENGRERFSASIHVRLRKHQYRGLAGKSDSPGNQRWIASLVDADTQSSSNTLHNTKAYVVIRVRVFFAWVTETDDKPERFRISDFGFLIWGTVFHSRSSKSAIRNPKYIIPVVPLLPSYPSSGPLALSGQRELRLPQLEQRL